MKKILKNNYCAFQIEILEDVDNKLLELNQLFGLEKFHQIGSDYYFKND